VRCPPSIGCGPNTVSFKLIFLSLRYFNEFPRSSSCVGLTGRHCSTISEPLDPMGQPPRHQGKDKENRVHIGGETHSAVDDSVVEVNVGIDAAGDAELYEGYKNSSSAAIF
jgi:hypothetical protein